MYNCGPTVYDYFHVGNARNFVCADIIRRYLAYRGYQVTFVQNITDIDDKIINRAREAGCPASEIAERYTKVFFESSAKLGVRPADHHPRATQYVGKMIAMVRKLEKAGYAYTSEGDVYFRVQKLPEYGKLSGRKLEDLLSGARVEVSEKKEHPADFVLWKAAKEGEPSWPSPWGPGRPGWHLECSVMSIDLLGETFDIHMGGADLVFPTTKTRSPRARRPRASRSCATGCTTAFSTSTVKRCPSRSGTSSPLTKCWRVRGAHRALLPPERALPRPA
jgi:cysteinyl-tRNA synthetase